MLTSTSLHLVGRAEKCQDMVGQPGLSLLKYHWAFIEDIHIIIGTRQAQKCIKCEDLNML